MWQVNTQDRIECPPNGVKDTTGVGNELPAGTSPQRNNPQLFLS